MPHRSNALKLIHQRMVLSSRETGGRALDKVYSESGLSPMNISTYMEHGINYQRPKREKCTAEAKCPDIPKPQQLSWIL